MFGRNDGAGGPISTALHLVLPQKHPQHSADVRIQWNELPMPWKLMALSVDDPRLWRGSQADNAFDSTFWDPLH